MAVAASDARRRGGQKCVKAQCLFPSTANTWGGATRPEPHPKNAHSHRRGTPSWSYCSLLELLLRAAVECARAVREKEGW